MSIDDKENLPQMISYERAKNQLLMAENRIYEDDYQHYKRIIE